MQAPDGQKGHEPQFWAVLRFDEEGNVLPIEWVDEMTLVRRNALGSAEEVSSRSDQKPSACWDTGYEAPTTPCVSQDGRCWRNGADSARVWERPRGGTGSEGDPEALGKQYDLVATRYSR